MSLNRLVIICILPTFLAGCSEFYSSQPPAPMYGGLPKSQKSSANTQRKTKSKTAVTKQTVKTEPLKDYSVIKSEPLALVPLEPMPLEMQSPAFPSITPIEPPESLISAPAPTASAINEPAPAIARPQGITPQQIAPPPLIPATPELTPFAPLESTIQLSPAVGALVSAANQNSKAGDLESAAASIERAIRIEPRNATLFYKLAVIRIKQAKPRLAEDLAKKSELLAATDNTLKKHCWLLIAHAREMQQNFSGAKEARAKADR